MATEYDKAKSERNARERGLPFSMAEAFDWSSARVEPDERRDYGEPRFVAVGRIEGRVCVMVFTPRGESLRVISLRKANSREVRDYEKA